MNKSNTIISYKGFDKDFKCRDFQFKVGKEYEEQDITICKKGFHACESPLEVWDHYGPHNSRFAIVEQSGEIQKEDNTSKVCSSKIKIKAELSLKDIIRLGIEWIREKTSFKEDGENSSGYSAQIGSSGDYAKIGSSGDSAQIGSSGDYAKIGSSGYSAKIGSSGYSAQIGSSGYSAKIGSSGYSAKIGSSGDSAKIGSSGDSAKIGSSGYYAQIGSSGDYAKIGSSGDSAQIGSSGDYAQIDSSGKHTVICCAGRNSVARAKVGSWITLSEWAQDGDIWKPVCVKTEYVDGERIKANTFYKLVKGVFEEYK